MSLDPDLILPTPHPTAGSNKSPRTPDQDEGKDDETVPCVRMAMSHLQTLRLGDKVKRWDGTMGKGSDKVLASVTFNRSGKGRQ